MSTHPDPLKPLGRPACSIAGCQYPCQHVNLERASSLPAAASVREHQPDANGTAGPLQSSQETAVLRYIGDGMQSAASRMAEWMRRTQVPIPYGVRMAAIEAQDYVDQWTEARTGYATESAS